MLWDEEAHPVSGAMAVVVFAGEDAALLRQFAVSSSAVAASTVFGLLDRSRCPVESSSEKQGDCQEES